MRQRGDESLGLRPPRKEAEVIAAGISRGQAASLHGPPEHASSLAEAMLGAGSALAYLLRASLLGA